MMKFSNIFVKNEFSFVYHTLKRQASLFCISDEVRQAFLDKKPVVALESTIITHGMKFPYNYKTAREVENLIREQNSVPATIAVISGQVKVGLNKQELEKLASDQKNCVKISRRDFPYVISHKLSGGTTVSGTMVIAHKVGIPIFVTGGIGGVHRDGENTMDISADLTELGKTPVVVISSGVKSILDVGRTLEYLETQGVAVATYGQSKVFPSFYCRTSSHNSPYNLTSDEEAAKFVQTIFDLKLNSGILIAVPIPEEYSLDEKAVETAIKKGLREAERENIKGKDITPFLLNKISQITEGESLKSNIELIKNNAIVGGKIAFRLSNLRQQSHGSNSEEAAFNRRTVRNGGTSVTVTGENEYNVVVVGGTNLDFVVNIRDENFKTDGRTIRGEISQTGGGVARNIADALGKLQANPFLVSAVGNEEIGDFILENTIPHLNQGGILKLPNANTGTCMVLCDHTGECLIVVGNMAIHDHINESHLKAHENTIVKSSLVVLDGNLSQEATEFMLRLCCENSVPVWFEPTDVFRASKPFKDKNIPFPTFISPNYQEFQKIFEMINPEPGKEAESEKNLEELIRKGYLLAEDVENIIITLGKEGVLVIRRGRENDPFFTATAKPKYLKHDQPISHRLYKPNMISKEEIVNVSGAGDCFASGFIAAMLKGSSEKSCVESAFKCSFASLKSSKTVPSNFY